MSITDQQFETMLTRLEKGEDLISVQADFPHLKEDIAALQDLQDFFAAQRLQAQPDPDGLKAVLRQIKALEESEMVDDDIGWGAWFAPWRRSLGVALPALLILGVSGYVWQGQIATTQVAETQISEPVAAQARMAAPAVLVMADTSAEVAKTVPVPSDMDMGALADWLTEEFASDLNEFESTRTELEPLYAEQLFSYQVENNPRALWKI